MWINCNSVNISSKVETNMHAWVIKYSFVISFENVLDSRLWTYTVTSDELACRINQALWAIKSSELTISVKLVKRLCAKFYFEKYLWVFFHFNNIFQWGLSTLWALKRFWESFPPVLWWSTPVCGIHSWEKIGGVRVNGVSIFPHAMLRALRTDVEHDQSAGDEAAYMPYIVYKVFTNEHYFPKQHDWLINLFEQFHQLLPRGNIHMIYTFLQGTFYTLIIRYLQQRWQIYEY